MRNHIIGKAESEKDYSDDDLVMIKAKVKGLYHGRIKIGDDIAENTYIRCFVDTHYGPLEIVHTIEQILKTERHVMRVGSIIVGLCRLSGNAAISVYEKGAIFDEEHNLRLLRYVFTKGNAIRAEYAFVADASYISTSHNNSCIGRKEIITRIQDIYDKREGDCFAHMAKITTVKADGNNSPEYDVGKRCVVLARGEEHKYEALVFVDVNEEGRIIRLSICTDSRYRFRIDEKP